MTVLDLTMRVSADSGRAKFCRMSVDGSVLTTWTWTDGRRPRETVRECADGAEAAAAFDAFRKKKLREGFAYVADSSGAVRGDIVLDLKAPFRCTGGFDLSPDGRTLVVGTMRDNANCAEIHLIDVGTNDRRLVHTEAGVAGAKSPLPHAVSFDAEGRQVVYALDGTTRLLDLASGKSRTLASYVQFQDARYNPFRVRPYWDAARRRLLVFDSGDMVRVLDRAEDTLFETSTARPSFECWAGALSPSGKLLALCFSKGSRYSEDNSQVVEVEVWDVDAQQLKYRLPMDDRPYTVGFDPADTMLVVTSEHVEGPVAFLLDSGELAWYCPEPRNAERRARCHGWAYSPDGSAIAVGGRGETRIVDAATREYDDDFVRRPGEGGTGRTDIIRFSADQTLVASSGDNGRIIVRRF